MLIFIKNCSVHSVNKKNFLFQSIGESVLESIYR